MISLFIKHCAGGRKKDKGYEDIKNEAISEHLFMEYSEMTSFYNTTFKIIIKKQTENYFVQLEIM